MQHARQGAGRGGAGRGGRARRGSAALFMPPSAFLHTVLLHRPARLLEAEDGSLRAAAQTCNSERPVLVLVLAFTPITIQTAQCRSARAIAMHCEGERRWREQTRGRQGTSTAIIGINKGGEQPTAERGQRKGAHQI